MTLRSTAPGVDPPDQGTGLSAGIPGGLDGPALLALYDAHYQRMCQYAAFQIGDNAEDVVAEVFATAWRIRDRFDPNMGEPTGWLFGIARTLIARHRRVDARRVRAWIGMAAHTETTIAEDVADRVAGFVDARAAATALAGAVAALPADQREVLLLTVLGGLAPAEIAVAQAIPAATVRTRLHRARSAARAHLRAEGIDHV